MMAMPIPTMKTRSKTPKPKPKPVEIITQSEVRQEDILVGKYYLQSRHIGNLAFRALIGSRLQSYATYNPSDVKAEVVGTLMATKPTPRMLEPHPNVRNNWVVMDKEFVRKQVCSEFKLMTPSRRATASKKKWTFSPHLDIQFPSSITYSQILFYISNLSRNMAIPSNQIAPVPDGGFPTIATVPNPAVPAVRESANTEKRSTISATPSTQIVPVGVFPTIAIAPKRPGVAAQESVTTKNKQVATSKSPASTKNKKRVPIKKSQAPAKKKKNHVLTMKSPAHTENKDQGKKGRAPVKGKKQAPIKTTSKISTGRKQAPNIVSSLDEDDKKMIDTSNLNHSRGLVAQTNSTKRAVFQVSPDPVKATVDRHPGFLHGDDLSDCDPLNFLEGNISQSSMGISEMLGSDYTLLGIETMAGVGTAPRPAMRTLNHSGAEHSPLCHPDVLQFVSNPNEHASKPAPQRVPSTMPPLIPMLGPIPGRDVLTAEETRLLEMALENQIAGLCDALQHGPYMADEIARRRMCVAMLRNWLRHYASQGDR